MIVTKINSLNEFIDWADQFKNGQYLFRGVSDKCYPVEASTYRRLAKKKDVDKTHYDILRINLGLLAEARHMRQDMKSGRQLTDLELLAELQHMGAATCLIDFTRSALVALWFACRQGSSAEHGNGSVVVLRTDGLEPLKTVDYQTIGKDLDYFFQLDEDLRFPLYQWHPSFQNNRIIAQQSVFVFGAPRIEIQKNAICEVVKCKKEEIQRNLSKLAGITETSLFPDFEGIARVNAHTKPYIGSIHSALRERGIDEYEWNELDNAINYLNEANENLSQLIESDGSELLRLEKLHVHFHLGRVYHRKGKLYDKSAFDQAIKEYTKAIELDKKLAIVYAYRSRVYYGKSKSGIDKDANLNLVIADCNRAIALNDEEVDAYNMRGNAYAEKREFDRAIKDFTKVIELRRYEPRYYSNRGETWLHLGKMDEARNDLNFAKDKGFDIPASFRNDYDSVESFENITGIKLPPDIIALLTKQ